LGALFFFPVWQESIFFVSNDDFLKKIEKSGIFYDFIKTTG